MMPWLLGLALAQAPEALDSRLDDDRVLEIEVVGEHSVGEARRAVVQELEGLGYRVQRRDGGDVILAPPSGWMGRVRLTSEGLLRFRRPQIGLTRAAPRAEDYNAFEETKARPQAAGGAGLQFWIFPSKRKVDAAQGRVAQAVDPVLRAYRDALADQAFGETLRTLPGRLDGLWASGAPLRGGTATLETPTARRQDALAYWSGLPGGLAGDEASRVVEAWLREVVMASEHPVTLEEQVEANTARRDERRLDLLEAPAEIAD